LGLLYGLGVCAAEELSETKTEAPQSTARVSAFLNLNSQDKI
jgi:hypothetical protein